MEVFINNEICRYTTVDITLHNNKLIDFVHVNLSELDINVQIGDILYILQDNKLYCKMKITDIIFKESKNIKNISITAKSKTFELQHMYFTTSIQFRKGITIFNMLKELGFNTTGTDFKILYNEDIIFKIGDNVASILSRIMLEHGYIFVTKDDYILNIEKVINNNTTHIIKRYVGLEYHKQYINSSINIFAETSYINDKWDFKSIGDDIYSKVLTPAYSVEVKDLEVFRSVAIERLKRSEITLRIKSYDLINVYTNEIITIENLPKDIEDLIFYVDSLKIIESGLVEYNLKVRE